MDIDDEDESEEEDDWEEAKMEEDEDENEDEDEDADEEEDEREEEGEDEQDEGIRKVSDVQMRRQARVEWKPEAILQQPGALLCIWTWQGQVMAREKSHDGSGTVHGHRLAM